MGMHSKWENLGFPQSRHQSLQNITVSKEIKCHLDYWLMKLLSLIRKKYQERKAMSDKKNTV